MENCGCKKSNLTACEFIGVILSLVAGVAVGILFAFGLIPIALNLITIALVFSVVVIAILIFSLFELLALSSSLMSPSSSSSSPSSKPSLSSSSTSRLSRICSTDYVLSSLTDHQEF